MQKQAIESVQRDAASLVQRAPQITAIETAWQADTVAAYRAEVREYRARIEAFFRPDIDAAHALHKSLLAKMKEVDAAPAKADAECVKLLADWTDRERQRIAEQQRKLDDEARARAAAEAREDGDTRTAKAIETGKLAVVSDVTAAPAAKIEGLSTHDVWSAEVVDLAALVKAVVKGDALLSYVLPDMTRLNAVMRATRGKQMIPGVRAVRKTSVAQRRAV